MKLVFEVGTDIALSYKKTPIDFIGTKPKHRPKVTVQITAYNERDDLIKCLDSIYGQTFTDYEVILVDNGLDADIVKQAKQRGLLYIPAGENLGCCGGRNLGAAHASGELIAFIDADGYVENNFLANAVAALDDQSLVAVRGKVLPFENTDDLPGHYNLGDKPGTRLIDTEGCSIWRTDDYRRVGGFEDSLAGGEGLVLCYRMWKLYGYDQRAFGYNPSFVLYHDFHSTADHLRKKLYKQAVTRDAIQKKYPDIAEFERFYRLHGPKPIVQKDLQIATIAEDTKRQVAAEFSELYDKKQADRYSHAEAVKSREKFDFTVVIPCYNLGELVTKAVDSVMRQSIDTVQVIVVDDASDDPETKQVLKDLEAKVQVVYADKNGGVAAARNLGINHARSEYILCLDADDTIEPTYLEKAKSMFDMDDSTGIVTCWAQYFGDVDSQWRIKPDITLAKALVGSPIHTASCFRRSAWQQVGGYESRLRGYEDWEFWINIIKHDWKVAVIGELLFNYYVRPGSKVNTSNKNADKILAVFFDKHREAFVDNLEYVIVEKHKAIARLRSENRALQQISLKLVLLNSPLGPSLKLAKKAVVLTKKHGAEIVSEYKSTGSVAKSSEMARRKSSILVSRIKRKLSK